MIKRRFYMAAMLAATLTVGCTKLDPSEQTVFDRPETEQIIVIAMDLSGSFADLMTKDGLAYRFVLATVDRYLRENSGGDGRLVIAQLSATGNPLLWEGKPSDLRRHFGSADSFREFLLSKSDPRGSRINEGVANALDYTINHASVRSNGAKPALFVLSDMMDNDPAGADHMKRVNELLGDFADVGGVIGLYYVNQSMLIDWRTRIESSGVRDSRIECGIVSNPDLPVFF